MGDIAFMVLDSFLVAAELFLDLVDANVHRCFGRRSHFLGNKIVLVRGNQDFHVPAVLAVIDGHFDRHQAGEVFEELLGLVMPMAAYSTVPNPP